MPEQVAEGRELASVAAVFPALGLGAETDDSDLAVSVVDRWGC